jgi:biotin carboxylase
VAGELWRVPGDRMSQGANFVIDLTKVTDLAREEAATLVYSVSSDVAIAAAVKASEMLRLRTYFDSDFVALLDDKAALRELLNAAGVSIVDFRRLKSVEDGAGWTTFPCVVKPVDSQGQRAVSKVNGSEDFSAAVAVALENSPTRTAIAEAYLEGVEVSCNVFVRDGRILMQEFSERLVHEGPRIGIVKGHIVPPQNVTKHRIDAARDLVSRVTELLGLRDGPLYFQIIMTGDGPKIVEIAPRLDGCHMWRLIEACRGSNLLDLVLDGLSGDYIATSAASAQRGPMILQFFQQPPGTVFDQRAYQVPDDAFYHEFRYHDGDVVLAVNGALEVVGYAIYDFRV